MIGNELVNNDIKTMRQQIENHYRGSRGEPEPEEFLFGPPIRAIILYEKHCERLRHFNSWFKPILLKEITSVERIDEMKMEDFMSERSLPEGERRIYIYIHHICQETDPNLTLLDIHERLHVGRKIDSESPIIEVVNKSTFDFLPEIERYKFPTDALVDYDSVFPDMFFAIMSIMRGQRTISKSLLI